MWTWLVSHPRKGGARRSLCRVPVRRSGRPRGRAGARPTMSNSRPLAAWNVPYPDSGPVVPAVHVLVEANAVSWELLPERPVVTSSSVEDGILSVPTRSVAKRVTSSISVPTSRHRRAPGAARLPGDRRAAPGQARHRSSPSRPRRGRGGRSGDCFDGLLLELLDPLDLDACAFPRHSLSEDLLGVVGEHRHRAPGVGGGNQAAETSGLKSWASSTTMCR